MTPIYHITHFQNLAGVLRAQGLVCDEESANKGFCKQSIGHAHIKERRARIRVIKNDGSPVGAGKTLSCYVPFYFTNRSPMLYSIHKGNVAGYEGRQNDVVYLVSSVEAVMANQVCWCFTDGHAVEGLSEFYDELSDLSRIDWPVIESWKWSEPLQDPDRKRRKQAEFLVYRQFPWSLVSELGVMDRNMLARVESLIGGISHRPSVKVQQSWYYHESNVH